MKIAYKVTVIYQGSIPMFWLISFLLIAPCSGTTQEFSLFHHQLWIKEPDTCLSIEYGVSSRSLGPLQAQLVKDRHSLIRMGSLYSDEEEEVAEPPPEKVQMTWTKEKCEAERRNRNNTPENFRELISLKPWVRFCPFRMRSNSLYPCISHLIKKTYFNAKTNLNLRCHVCMPLFHPEVVMASFKNLKFILHPKVCL